MPPPLDALAVLVRLPDATLAREVALGGRKMSVQFVLYDVLRHEQALAVDAQRRERSEIVHILDFAQIELGELVGLLVGRADDLLGARDGEWSLRDLLRHAIAVELRYGAQVEYAATRRDDDPLAIPDRRLPCDRLTPPEPEFAASRTGGLAEILELLAAARDATARRLAHIPDASLTRPSLWGSLEMSVRMRAHQIAAHLAEVAVQSEKMLGADAHGSEARRILRRCCAARSSRGRERSGCTSAARCAVSPPRRDPGMTNPTSYVPFELSTARPRLRDYERSDLGAVQRFVGDPCRRRARAVRPQ